VRAPSRRTAAAAGALVAAGVAIALLPVPGVSAVQGTVAAAPALKGVTPEVRAWRADAPVQVAVGTSVRGRPFVARRQGPADAPYAVLVLGQMHGSEPRGRAVVRELRRLAPPGQVQVWSIVTMNPDGGRVGTRRNARQVDLNRNFPNRWRPTFTDRIYYPGPREASEPETRAFMAFADRLRPDLIVSFHQAYRSVDIGNPKTRTWSRRLARALGLPMTVVPCRGPCAGTLVGWYNARYTGYAVTVELPARVPEARARRYARATVGVAGMLAPQSPPTPTPTPTPTGSGSPSTSPTPSATNTPTPAPGA
jgi:predicted deacylase